MTVAIVWFVLVGSLSVYMLPKTVDGDKEIV